MAPKREKGSGPSELPAASLGQAPVGPFPSGEPIWDGTAHVKRTKVSQWGHGHPGRSPVAFGSCTSTEVKLKPQEAPCAQRSFRGRSGSSCKSAINTSKCRGAISTLGFVLIASALETELNSSQQKNKDSSELYCNSLPEIYEYDCPVKSSIFLFTTRNL